MNQHLFAVYLGGRAAKCNTELHDVVFVIGSSIEATYERLMDKWFGDPLRMQSTLARPAPGRRIPHLVES
jgi:hypothetical protein